MLTLPRIAARGKRDRRVSIQVMIVVIEPDPPPVRRRRKPPIVGGRRAFRNIPTRQEWLPLMDLE